MSGMVANGWVPCPFRKFVLDNGLKRKCNQPGKKEAGEPEAEIQGELQSFVYAFDEPCTMF